MVISDVVIISVISAVAAMVGAFIAALPALVIALKTQAKVAEVHTLTNSLSEKLLAETKANYEQRGHTRGVSDEKVRAFEVGANSVPIEAKRV